MNCVPITSTTRFCDVAAEAGTSWIVGSLTKTKVAITARISTGPTVHASSSLFAPWICAPSASRGRFRRRYRITNAMRRPSTSRKIAKANSEMKR